MAKMSVLDVKTKALPSKETICTVLDYDPGTGHFRWNRHRGRVSAGDIAGTITNDGYLIITIDRERYLAHRLAWKFMTGEDPPMIDHANCNRIDNSWSNLRVATQTQNRANEKSRTGKLKGAFYDARADRWYARIQLNRKFIHLGCFKTDVEAHNAYLNAARLAFGEFARAA